MFKGSTSVSFAMYVPIPKATLIFDLKCSYKQDITYFLVGVSVNKYMMGLAYNNKLGYVLLDMLNLKFIQKTNFYYSNSAYIYSKNYGMNVVPTLNYYMKNNIIIKSVYK